MSRPAQPAWALAKDLDALEEYQRARPSDWYKPGRLGEIPDDQNGQLQFHRAPHVFRLLAPGNGFGKTTCSAVEVDWWIQRTHPFASAWPEPLPADRPISAVWVCEKFQQFEIQRAKLERWFSAGWRWVGMPKAHYRWPQGTLWVISGDSDWRHIQGIEIDLVIVDEECNPRLWRELRMRRRAGVRTHYVVSATATGGLGWMYQDLYLPWLKFHQERGHDEAAAMRLQLHQEAGLPWCWVWARGGVGDNPAAGTGDVAYYQALSYGSPAERAVRLGGGFRSFNSTPVFEPEQIERMKAAIRPGLSGRIVPVPAS